MSCARAQRRSLFALRYSFFIAGRCPPSELYSRSTGGFMTRLVKTVGAMAVVMAGASVLGQSAMPFKLGTFDQNGRAFVGVVIKDALVLDLAQASAALKSPASKVASPTDMKDLIARYDSGVRARIGEILANTKQLEGAGRAAFIHDITSLKTLPPIMYPTTMLNVAVNYRAHGAEMAAG